MFVMQIDTELVPLTGFKFSYSLSLKAMLKSLFYGHVLNSSIECCTVHIQKNVAEPPLVQWYSRCRMHIMNNSPAFTEMAIKQVDSPVETINATGSSFDVHSI